MNYSELRDRAIKLRTSVTNLKQEVSKDLHMREELYGTLKEVKVNKVIQESSIKVVKEVMDRMSKEHIQQVESIVTHALQAICTDCDYYFQVKVSDKRNTKSAEFFLIDKTNKDANPTEAPVPDGVGGGISSIIGFVLQTYYIMRYNLAPVLIMDESLSMISDDYLQNLLVYMQTLSEKKNFRFIIVTHDARISDKSNVIYEVADGTIKLRKDEFAMTEKLTFEEIVEKVVDGNE